jgi:hypothetical protein
VFFFQRPARHIKQARGSHSPGRWLQVRGVRGHSATASSSLVGPIHLCWGHQHSTWWQGSGWGCAGNSSETLVGRRQEQKSRLAWDLQEPQAQQLRTGAAWLKVNLVQDVCLGGDHSHHAGNKGPGQTPFRCTWLLSANRSSLSATSPMGH